MKKILSLILSFALTSMFLPIGGYAQDEAGDYISVPLEIGENEYNVMAMVDYNESVKANYNSLSLTNNYDMYLIDINDVKNNANLKWKEPWTTGKTSNIATYKDVDYQITTKSASTGYAALRLNGGVDKTFNLADGCYTKIMLLANSWNGVGCYRSLELTTGIVLNYADGTQEYKQTKAVYSPFNRSNDSSDDAIELKTVKLSGGLWSMNTVTAGASSDTKLAYIHVYEIEVDSKKTLESVTVLSEKTSATQNGDTVTLSTKSSNVNSSTNIFAMTAVTTKSAIQTSLKNRLKNIVRSNVGLDIGTNTDFYNSVKAVYDETVSYGIEPERVFEDYFPTVSDFQILGTYGENETLTLYKIDCDPFGRNVTLSDIKWYKSETLTDDETLWTEIGRGDSYTLKGDDIGSYIYSSAVPVCSAVDGIPAIKTQGGRKTSEVFFAITAPEAKDVYFKVDRKIESTYPNEEISVNYTYVDLNGDTENGTVFTFEKSSEIDGEYTPVQSGTTNKYIVKNEDLNYFIRCKVKVKNSAEKGNDSEEVISRNMYLVQDDTTNFGTKLYGEYGENKLAIVLINETLNQDEKDVSSYEWYTTDNITNAFPYSWTKSDINSQLFKVTSDVFGKYVAVVVTTKIEKDGNITIGDEIVKYFYLSSVPLAYDVIITSDNEDEKNVKSGDKLTGTYKYIDPNGDIENGTKVSFEKSTDGENWQVLAENVSEYTLTENDINMYIRFCVTPVSEGTQDNTGETVPSEKFITPFAPEVSNAVISGTAKVGQTLSANYTFVDKNGNADVDSEIIWYSLDGTTKTQIGTGVNCILTSKEAGKNVMYEITPKTTVDPKIGTKADSLIIAVNKDSTIGSSSINSGLSSYKGTTTTAPPLEYIQKEPEVIFSDISGHWAEKSILAMNEKGYMTGFEKKFRPDDFITKAELSAVVCRVLKLKDEFAESFIDVSEDSWYGAYVESLYKNNIVNGDNGYFYPTNNITRQETAKIFSEAYKYKKNLRNATIKDISSFNDSEIISDWAKEYVGVVYNLGLMNGDTASNFNPDSNLTRAEACAIIERFSALK